MGYHSTREQGNVSQLYHQISSTLPYNNYNSPLRRILYIFTTFSRECPSYVHLYMFAPLLCMHNTTMHTGYYPWWKTASLRSRRMTTERRTSQFKLFARGSSNHNHICHSLRVRGRSTSLPRPSSSRWWPGRMISRLVSSSILSTISRTPFRGHGSPVKVRTDIYWNFNTVFLPLLPKNLEQYSSYTYLHVHCGLYRCTCTYDDLFRKF